MASSSLLPLLFLLPALAAPGLLILRSARHILRASLVVVSVTAALAGWIAVDVLRTRPAAALSSWLYVDALSAYHLMILATVFVLATVYAQGYFAAELEDGSFDLSKARQFGALWVGSMAAMILVLISNNVGITWVGLEATTAVTTFLICLKVTPGSLEAMWKYLLICSIGLGLAFMGTLLTAAAAVDLGLGASDALLWTTLRDHAAALHPTELRIGFLFILVGYGTKAGLAPMHSWLPDAHSQAPGPVSALFSGFMLNAALYCVMRFVPLVEGLPGGQRWALDLLVLFGLASILLAAAFILFQRDVKRLLAYHSVEHLGIIALGLGLGGLGTFAALFHTLNHSLCKTVAFFSAARLGRIYGTHDMEAIRGSLRAAPLWGVGLLGSLLALIGVAPFALFMSEFQILQAAVERHAILPLILFLVGAGVVFVSALSHALSMAWGRTERSLVPDHASPWDAVVVLGPLAVLLMLGLWMPAPLADALSQAAAIVGGAR